MKGKVINFQDDYKEGKIAFLDENPKINFKLEKIKKDEYKLESNYDFRNLYILEGSKFKYILKDNITDTKVWNWENIKATRKGD